MADDFIYNATLIIYAYQCKDRRLMQDLTKGITKLKQSTTRNSTVMIDRSIFLAPTAKVWKTYSTLDTLQTRHTHFAFGY